MLPRYLISVFIILALPVAVLAQSVATAKPGDPVAEARGYTYADLLGQFIPGLEVRPNGDAVGEGGFTLDHIEGEAFGQQAPVNIVVRSIEAVSLKNRDKPHIALLLDLGESTRDGFPVVVLALYDISGRPRFVDFDEVGGDQWVHFAFPPKVVTGSGSDILIVTSTHANSSQYYVLTSLIDAAQGELRLVDTIRTLSSSLCGFTRTQALAIAADKVTPEPGTIVATVTEELRQADDDCGTSPIPEPFVETYSVRYRWDESSKSHVTPEGAWEELDAINEARF